ncbi:MAG: hypothetical protein ABIY40_01975 [Rhodanobacteraceae bacterium]
MLESNRQRVQNLTGAELWMFIVARVLLGFAVGVLAMIYFPTFFIGSSMAGAHHRRVVVCLGFTGLAPQTAIQVSGLDITVRPSGRRRRAAA